MKNLHPEIAKLTTLAMRSHQGISFDPEKRGQQILASHNSELLADIEIIKQFGGDVDAYVQKYCAKFSAWLAAKGRCISTMITGPANFPVRRAEKANESEYKRLTEFIEWRKKVLNKIQRPESTDIVKGESGALDKLRARLSKLEQNQEDMKAMNKILRAKNLSREEKIKKIITDFPYVSEDNAALIYKDGWFGHIGFKSMTLNNAAIRKLKQDIAHEERRLQKYESGNKEYEISGVRVVENAGDNRIQLHFDGKPPYDMIQKLKSNGFRWSPRNMAWQRQLTDNAVRATKYILS